MLLGALIHSAENCIGVDGLILLNFCHQDVVEIAYDMIAEYKQFFKHLVSDLRIATPFGHASCFASAHTETGTLASPGKTTTRIFQ
jgi:hypothetical protein